MFGVFRTGLALALAIVCVLLIQKFAFLRLDFRFGVTTFAPRIWAQIWGEKCCYVECGAVVW